MERRIERLLDATAARIVSGTGKSARARREPAPEPEPEEAAPSPSANGPGSIGLDALNQMFEHGRQIQDDHQNALKSILDAMLGGGQGRR